MKLQDFLIGLGLFGLFTTIIFSAINTTNDEGIYGQNYLNITHDEKTGNAIVNITSVGETTSSEFNSTSDDMKGFSGGEEPDETKLVGSALKTLINIPNSWRPVANILRMMEEQFKIPAVFTQWLLNSVIIIIILILIASFLKNKLQS